MSDETGTDPPDEANAQLSAAAAGAKSFGLTKIILLVAVAALFALLYYNYRDQLSLTAVAAHENKLLDYGHAHPVLIVVVAFLIYTAVTGLSLPGAAGLTLVMGWLFKSLYGDLRGLATAMVLVSFASTSGATLAFLLSRFLFRETIQARFGEYLTRFNTALQREGAFYLFTLRLIPAVPFFVINAVMGLTPIRVTTFWWVSQLGMLAGTAVYVYAGSAVPTISELAEQGTSGILTPQIIIAFVLLGLFPLIVKKVMARLRPATNGTTG